MKLGKKKKKRSSERGYFYKDLKISHITGYKIDDIEEEEETVDSDYENQAFLNESIDSETFESMDFETNYETKLLEENDSFIMNIVEQVWNILKMLNFLKKFNSNFFFYTWKEISNEKISPEKNFDEKVYIKNYFFYFFSLTVFMPKKFGL